MRVITGSARGRCLQTLPGEAVRPTPERVKEGVFSAIQFGLPGSRFLDLFAGSGQMGLEALSRGAAFCAFCDFSREAAETVRHNLRACGFETSASVAQADYAAFLSRCREPFDFAFLDPPYASRLWADALGRAAAVMRATGVMLCEHPEDAALPETVAEFRAVKRYRYGKIAVTAYRKGAV